MLWLSVLLGIVIAQIGATTFFPAQKWSMTIGLACIVLSCAAITIIIRPHHLVTKWRWHLTTLGFVIWGLGFVAIAYQDNFLGSVEWISSVAAVLRQICFIVVLMPSSGGEYSRQFRFLDIAQGLVFSLSLGLLTLKPLSEAASQHADARYAVTGYVALALLSTISYYSQDNRYCKSLTGNLCVMFVIYAIVSTMAIYINNRYIVHESSIVWLIGDLSFLVYFVLSIRTSWFGSVADAEPVSKPIDRRHLSPLFVAIMILVLAIEIAEGHAWLGMAMGSLGLLIYAARTTMLLDHYLAARDEKILAEQLHSRLLIDMIHEIRAPLASVVLNASLLRHIEGLPPRQVARIDQIGLGGARVTTILNDVLEIERIDAGLIDAKPSMCDLKAVVDTSIAVVAAQAAVADIDIRVERDGGGEAWADGAMLERVLINLLMNAVRFTPAGGRIRVTLQDEEREVAIRVRDNGVGIPLSVQATLFDRFSHVGVPLRGNRGSGLGLSICRGLMTLMDGRLAIESSPGEGTTAIVHVPRAQVI